MKDRLQKFLIAEKLSAAKFAEDIGVQRSSISHILSGRNNPGLEFIQKLLARYKYINPEWLIMGSGSMYKSNLPLVSDATTTPELAITDTPSVGASKSVSDAPELPFKVLDSINVEEVAAKQIEKIIVFYSDKSFSAYLPEK